MQLTNKHYPQADHGLWCASCNLNRGHVGVFRGVVRIPQKRPGPLALRALTNAQEVEDILAQLLDGDIGVSEAFDRYLAIDVEDNPAPSVDAVTIFTESITGRVAQ